MSANPGDSLLSLNRIVLPATTDNGSQYPTTFLVKSGGFPEIAKDLPDCSLERFAVQCNTVHQSFFSMIVVNGKVPGRSVVPECH